MLTATNVIVKRGWSGAERMRWCSGAERMQCAERMRWCSGAEGEVVQRVQLCREDAVCRGDGCHFILLSFIL